ncbi:MAG: class I SAM-dependent methyltransferase [Chitinispirillaceae bacterium]|nr:class I SAM-dependent methyltransferase [Chitinispirillaceae bacterium]
MDVRAYLLEHLSREALALWGERDAAYLGRVADDWLDAAGVSGSLYRLDRIRVLLPAANRILDMGAGCGTFVRFALGRGYDAYGIEPAAWKLEVVRRKAGRSGYERSWVQRIIAAVGETLPFDDDAFDCVTTFQTMEHVQDVPACCAEMLRVTRPGGCVYIRCPDYALSTYEGHYRLPWVPGLWGKPAERYLALCGKPPAGLRSLHPVSGGMLRRVFMNLGDDAGIRLRIVNVDERRARGLLHLPDGPLGRALTRPLFAARFLRLLFRIEYPVHLAVFVEGK